MDWPWVAVLVLGVWHGINPGMGWLFAVALGLQERESRAVWRALPPLALGHAAAIAAAVLVALLVGRAVPPTALKWAVAAVLLGFGVYKLVSTRHPSWGGMRVGARDLTVWSFLMGTAHGAGLMVVPFVLGATAGGGAGSAAHASAVTHASGAVDAGMAAGHASHIAPLLAGLPQDQLVGLVATMVHTAGYLLVTGVVALVVYRKLGLRLLRTAWINLDIVWAGALIATAVVTPLL